MKVLDFPVLHDQLSVSHGGAFRRKKYRVRVGHCGGLTGAGRGRKDQPMAPKGNRQRLAPDGGRREL